MVVLTGCGVEWFPGDETTSSVTITTTSLADAPTGFVYSQKLTASGGTGTYKWIITSVANIPEGLNLNPDTGIISGTPIALTTSAPTTPLEYKFTVKVSDTAITPATATKDLSIFTPTTGRMYDSTGKVYAENLTSAINGTNIDWTLTVKNTDSLDHTLLVVIANYDNKGMVIAGSDFNMKSVFLTSGASTTATDTKISAATTENNWRIKSVSIN
jgi:hypothetical protein